MRRLRALLDWVSSIGLLLAGLIGITVVVADVFGIHLTTKSLPEIILALLGILALSLGLERVLNLRGVEGRLDSLERVVAGAVGARFIEGRDQIYESMLPLISNAQRSFKTVAYGSVPKAPLWFAQAVAKRLREVKEAGGALAFDVVLALDASEVNDDFVSRVNERLQVFEKEGVRHLVHLAIARTNEPLGLEVFIIDETSAQIGFTTVKAAGMKDLQRAVQIEGQPVLCRDLADWFDNRVMPAAVAYKDQRAST